MFTLQELKSICSKKLEQYTKEKNEQKIKTFTLIQQMLEYEDALKKLGPEICFNIFYDLGFDKKQATQIYADLVLKQ